MLYLLVVLIVTGCDSDRVRCNELSLVELLHNASVRRRDEWTDSVLAHTPKTERYAALAGDSVLSNDPPMKGSDRVWYEDHCYMGRVRP